MRVAAKIPAHRASAGSDTTCGCNVGAIATSDDRSGCTGAAETAGPGVDVLVVGDGERGAPGIRVACASAGDDRRVDSGKAVTVDVSRGRFVCGLPFAVCLALRSRRARLTVRGIGMGDARRGCASCVTPGLAAGSEATR